jgi:hypothetical protein
MWAPYLELIAAHLEQVAHGKIKRLIITMPPRYLKSICVSVALPAFVLGHYPHQEVMCVSYGQDLAKKFSDYARFEAACLVFAYAAFDPAPDGTLWG